MSRKRSIPDNRTAGRSGIVPYRRGEDFRTRHWRRLSTLEQEMDVSRWCEQRGLTLRITTDIIGKSQVEFSWPNGGRRAQNSYWQTLVGRNSLS